MSLKYFNSLYINPNTQQLSSFNKMFKNIKYQLHFQGYHPDCSHYNVLPCSFTGNIRLKKPMVVISANPGLGNPKNPNTYIRLQKEQCNGNVKGWYNQCCIGLFPASPDFQPLTNAFSYLQQKKMPADN